MKGLLLILVGILFVSVVSAQSNISLDSCFKGGTSAFYNHLANTLNYPDKDKAKGVVGTELIQFEVNKNGEVIEVAVLNSLSKKIDENLIASIQGTSGNWEVTFPQSFILPVIYQLEENSFSYVPFPNEYLSINQGKTRTLLNNNLEQEFRFASIVKTDEYHIGEAKNYMISGEYKLALKHLDEMIRRDPLNKDHRATRINCYLKMGKSKKANKDLFFLTGMIQADDADDGIEDESLTANHPKAENLMGYAFFF